MVSCSALKCGNKSCNGWKLFRFPAGPRKAIWLKNMGRGDDWMPSESSRLCEKHFDSSQFETCRSDGWFKLKPNAIPTLFHEADLPPLTSYHEPSFHKRLENNGDEGDAALEPSSSTCATNEELGENITDFVDEGQRTSCVIAGCDSNSSTQPDIGYYPFPESKPMQRKWLKACSLRSEKLQVENVHICAKHFVEEDFITELKIQDDQTICNRELRSDVVPTVNLSLETIKSDEGEEIYYSALSLENQELNEKIAQLKVKLQHLRSCKEIEENECMTLSERYNKLKLLHKSSLKTESELLSKVFSETQVRALTTKRKVIWDDHDLAIAFTIRHLSNKQFYTYFTETLRYPFPALSTLQRWKKAKRSA